MSDTPLTDAEVARILETPMNHSSRFAALAEFAERLERKIGRMQKIGDEIVDSCPTLWQEEIWEEERRSQP